MTEQNALTAPAAAALVPVDRSWRRATGRAFGAAGDLVYSTTARVCLPVQVLASVAVKLRRAQRSAVRVVEATDQQSELIYAAAGLLPDGPWEIDAKVGSWFVPGAGMRDDAAVTVAAVRAFALALEIPTADALVLSITGKLLGDGTALALPGLTATHGAKVLSHYEWIPEMAVVSIVPVTTERVPVAYVASDPGPETELLARFAAAAADRDVLGLAEVATLTADRSGHSGLVLLEQASEVLATAGVAPLGRIVSHHGPAVGLLFPGDVDGRQMATTAIHALASVLAGKARISLARTPRGDR
jgi:uncharacterized protein involved in propanediol utilization